MQDKARSQYLITGYWKLHVDDVLIDSLIQIIVLYYYISDCWSQTCGSCLQFIENSMTALWVESEKIATSKLNYFTIYSKSSFNEINSKIKYVVQFAINNCTYNNHTWIGFTNIFDITSEPDNYYNYQEFPKGQQQYIGFEYFPSLYFSKQAHFQRCFIREFRIENNNCFHGCWNTDVFFQNAMDIEKIEKKKCLEICNSESGVALRYNDDDMEYYTNYSKESFTVFGELEITLLKKDSIEHNIYLTIKNGAQFIQSHNYSFHNNRNILKDFKLSISMPREAIFSLQHVEIA